MSNAERDTDTDWKRVAERDPYWGVLSEERFRKDNLDRARIKEFMETGEGYVGNVLGLIHKHIDPGFEPRRVLDFGCGVGRLLVPLAKRAQRAVGVDVAERMLEICAERASEAGVGHLELASDLSEVQGSFDLVNTYIVLQHIPPARGYGILRQLIEKLEVGGVCSFQLTYAKSKRFWPHEQPRSEYYRRDGDKLVELGNDAPALPPGTIQMYDYDLNNVMIVVYEYAGHPVLVLPTCDDGHMGVHLIFRRAR
jgi:2-polyprenyl-3-methyl-5-hydroxy-6-metoxy-1,4-benzoquinol methylase